jgi:thiamine pyrophosphate-dependent acetolactate synthase large subunit-like protein
VRVAAPEQLRETLRRAIGGPESVLIDVVVDRVVPPLLPER